MSESRRLVATRQPRSLKRAAAFSVSSPLAVLVLLAAGRTAAQVADATTWSRRRVVELARLRGWIYQPEADTVIAPLARIAQVRA